MNTIRLAAPASVPGSALEYTATVARETDHLYAKVARVIPEIEWPTYAPTIAAINRLKRETSTAILAHNYQTPEIFHCVADHVGDSLALAFAGAETKADTIMMAGVHFMAETAKIMAPEKTVLIADMRAGCSLADSITAEDVRLLREAHPGVPIITYVNTSAAVKAESDICCTSGNVVDIVNAQDSDTVLCIPDEYLAKYVATQTSKKVLTWKGHCEVHEQFTAEEIADFRAAHPGVVVLAHPECPPDVLGASDFVGSTAGMQKYVETKQPAKVVMITECSMSDNVAAANPNVEFVRPCNLCPHMKRITLDGMLQALRNRQPEVTVDPALIPRARQAVERMLALGRR